MVELQLLLRNKTFGWGLRQGQLEEVSRVV